ncbi:divergent polysaccharide deacetylase family protein [Roseomonas sp. JC162]|uniref:Divergent polysaccharide deacetylase family protein n=1 Tax=Neoroseomonas marina TaxID=1232220 RepID=A0A848E9G9_9PROT|nr:divergent polysaccharide deacetylase family protein [Neoroseomonas marina]
MPGWRWLGVFWAVVALGGAGTAWRLHQLGPPEPPAEASGQPQTPSSDPSPAVAEASPAAPPAAVPEPPAAEARPAAPAPMPAAPEPPPLAAAPAPASAAGRPIPAPDPALLETGRHGALPRIGADGRTSIRAYAREFDRRDTRPRIGIIVSDIGLSATQTDDAIRRLPPAVALALSPYAVRPGQAAERARERGMETLIAIPMEPAGYPTNDPGDRALLTGRPMAENLDLLDWSLSRAQGYVGAIGAIGGMRGERFAALPDAIGAVQEVLFRRGVLYVDPRPGAASPARAWGRSVDLVLDEPGGTRGEIDRRLAELEGLARERGAALGLSGSASPVVVERIAAWAQGLDARGLVLAPVSAMIRRPEGSASDSSPLRPASAP